MPAPFQSYIPPFVDSLRFEKRYSPHTIRSYQDDLVQFSDFLEKEFDSPHLAEISAPLVRSWLAQLKEKGLTAKSINRKISSLKGFFKYALRVELLDATPMLNIVAPKMSKRLPAYIEQRDMEVLLHQIEFGNDLQGQTEKLIINLFYHTGMRLSEMINLEDRQVDLHYKTVRVLGKGNKERIIPVGEELLGQIEAYRDTRKRELAPASHPYLLVDKKGNQLYHKAVYLVVKKYLQKVSTLHKKSPHVLRHTFATHLTNNGADLNAVKELLGHSSLAATQVYTHNSIEKLKQIHQKAHPKS
ncbi:MAG: tyrosine-type recombinase/integrase [Williamsia sp.]|nr:tyrosine-type recombinase/integrase [Williamsia sp.]